MDKSLILREIKLHYGFKKDVDFAKYLGIDPRILATWIHRKTLDYEILITKCNEISAEWIVTGAGSMLKKELNTSSPLIGLPLIPSDAFGGIGFNTDNTFMDKDIEQRYVIPEFENKADFLIRVKGSSMQPKYSSGDIVACKMIKELVFVQWNKPYVINSATQGIMIKRLHKGQDDKHITCKSDNKDYPDFEIPLKEVVNIALVIGVIHFD